MANSNQAIEGLTQTLFQPIPLRCARIEWMHSHALGHTLAALGHSFSEVDEAESGVVE